MADGGPIAAGVMQYTGRVGSEFLPTQMAALHKLVDKSSLAEKGHLADLECAITCATAALGIDALAVKISQ